MLRVETGRHGAVVTKIATAPERGLIATSALDKTVRLWSALDGKPEGVLRVPVGEGLEGALYSVALSPDGKTALATGYTGASWDGAFAIYVFDVPSRSIRTRLAKLPAVVNGLSFSPDGSAFAAVFGGTNGFAVWDAKTGKLLAQDKDYGDLARDIQFSPQGRIATVSYDGLVRLYDREFQLAAKVRTTGGSRPHSLAFSPDGRHLAIGYLDGGAVDVLSGLDLSPGRSLKSDGLNGGNLASVAWDTSSGHAEVIAAGTARDALHRVVLRRWGADRITDIPISRDTVMDLHSISGNLAFATAEPSWGVMRNGKVLFRNDADQGDFRDIEEGRFAISADGQVVEFGLRQHGAIPMRFNAGTRQLQPAPSQAPSLRPPAMVGFGLTVSSWKNSHRPLINGHPVALEDGEISRASAVSGPGRVLIGTNRRLLLVDQRGSPLAIANMPAETWGVAASGDGRRAVAALGDGTIRWFDLAPGHELQDVAAIFAYSGGLKWIGWTPEGFFAHSEGSDAEAVGYLINRGPRSTPEWIEFEHLYQLFYAPELFSDKLKGGNDDEIRRRQAQVGPVVQVLANRSSPTAELLEFCPIRAGRSTECAPVGKAHDLPDDVEAVLLKMRISDRKGGVGDIDVFSNGRIQSSRSAPPPDSNGGRILEQRLPLRPGTNTVWIRAYDQSNTVAGKSETTEFVRPSTAPQKQGAPRLMVMGIAVDAYSGKKPNGDALALDFPVKDMKAVVDAIAGQSSTRTYREIKVVAKLTDQQADRQGVIRAFTDAAKMIGPEDTAVIYLSGHGFTAASEASNPYYFLPVDGDIKRLTETSISQGDLKRALAELPARNILLLLDTCRGGAIAQESVDKVHQGLGRGFDVLAAAASDEDALDSYKNMHGPFAYAVLEGLRGEAATGERGVTQESLGHFVIQRLPQLVKEVDGEHQQTAVFDKAIPGGSYILTEK